MTILFWKIYLSIGVLPFGPGVNDILALFSAVGGTETEVITGAYGNSESTYSKIKD